MNWILFGFSKCGKSYYGKLLAEKLGRSFIDTDEQLEAIYEKRFHQRLSCRQIYHQKGDSFFRDLERDAIQSILEIREGVIALGGGALLDSQNQRSLRSIGHFLYLEVGEETLQKRLLEGALPAYLDPMNLLGSFQQMIRERRSIYERIPAKRIHMDNKLDQEILKELEALANGE